MRNYKARVKFVLIAVFAVLTATGCSENKTSVDKQSHLLERDYSPSIGPIDAKVTIVEFFDPACEACRAIYPHVKEILDRHKEDVRLVLRYATFHEGSDTAARILEAAREQDIFISVLEALLKDQYMWASHHNPNISKAWDLATNAGLDIAEAKKVLYSERFDKILQQDLEDIKTLRVNRTPTFFVNKKELGEFGAQQLYDLVVAELNN